MGKKTINPNSAVEGSRLIIGNKQIEVRVCINAHLCNIICKNLVKLILDYRSSVTREAC